MNNMCFACGLMDHQGNQKQYARNSENSRDAMTHTYTTVPSSGRYSSSKIERYN
ncbi:hypothetical protein J4423_04825 [Candidatus Pacearchaeota archaeon]|nr:hypothetical protein [Candidatus Pacearchaeota archaeon]